MATCCATSTTDEVNLSSVPGIISRDKNVLGREQETRGGEDLFLDLRQEWVKADVGAGGFDSAGWQWGWNVLNEDGLKQFTPEWNVIYLHCATVREWHREVTASRLPEQGHKRGSRRVITVMTPVTMKLLVIRYLDNHLKNPVFYYY